MKRIVLLSVFVVSPVIFGAALAAGSNEDLQEKKEALQELNDFIGQWKGSGTLADDPINGWREEADWGWRFKGKDCYLRLKILKGKFFREGELRYSLDDGQYHLTLTDKDKKKRLFKGKIRGKKLTLVHTDSKTKEMQRIYMNNAAGGVRLIYSLEVQPPNRSFFTKRFQVGYTKEGESFGTAKRKIECVVTGGLGTMAVSYQGVTYYVCCSGCRDAFMADPAKIIAEYKKKKRRRR